MISIAGVHTPADFSDTALLLQPLLRQKSMSEQRQLELDLNSSDSRLNLYQVAKEGAGEEIETVCE